MKMHGQIHKLRSCYEERSLQAHDVESTLNQSDSMLIQRRVPDGTCRNCVDFMNKPSLPHCPLFLTYCPSNFSLFPYGRLLRFFYIKRTVAIYCTITMVISVMPYLTANIN